MLSDNQLKSIYSMRDKYLQVNFNRLLTKSQERFSNIILKKVFNNEGGNIAGEFSRQQGKTECVGGTASFLKTHFFPIVEALNIPHTDFFNMGFFAPQQEQAKTDFDRIKNQLDILKLNNRYKFAISESNGTTLTLKSETQPIRQTFCFSASPTSNTESKTLNVIFLEEAQKLMDEKIDNTISPMGAHCVCGGTRVMNEHGEYVDIINIKEKILGICGDNTLSINNVHNFGVTGIKECFKLTTNSNRTLECSFDHPILIKDRKDRKTKWLNMGRLKEGTQIAIMDETGIFGDTCFFDARLVGMLIGDGSYRNRGMVRYCSGDKDLLDYVKNRYEFKCHASHITKRGELFEDGTIRGLCAELRKIGIYGQTGRNKRLPINIHSYKKEELCELLGGLYDTDGCVMVEERRRGRIYLDSCSEELLWEVFYQLERLGIHARIYAEEKKPCKLIKYAGIMYRLIICERESVLRFINNISLLVGYKQKRLDDLRIILKERKNKRQKNIAGLYFERIKKIENIGNRTVYNLTAEPENTYLANNIITHNTNALRVYIGTAGCRRCRFLEMIDKLPEEDVVISDVDTALKERRELYERTGDPIFLNYEKFIQGEKITIGETSDAYKMQYKLQWILARGQFITYKELFGLEHEFTKEQVYGRGETLYGGIDWGKMHDSTVFTIVSASGHIVDWLEMMGDDYSRQYDFIEQFIKEKYRFKLKEINCDSTGNQDMAVDELRKRMLKFGVAVKGIKLTAQMNDMMYKNLDRLMKPTYADGRVVREPIIKIPKANSPEKDKFMQQFLDLQKDIKNNLWVCENPPGESCHDDFCDSLCLGCLPLSPKRNNASFIRS